MKSLWRIAVPVGCVAIVGVAAIAWHFVEVRGIQKKLAEDAKLYRTRAEKGDTKAQYDLGRMYYYGKGVPQDYGEAITWYRKAAEQGNPEAEYGLAFMYREGKGVPQDPVQALDWCRKAADHGYARAEYALGNAYHHGWHVSQDYGAADAWYRKAAEQGFAEAQDSLGYAYSQGEGVSRDDSETVAWYRKAADQGNAHAQGALGYMYFEGRGVQRDHAEAARWYRKAARQGDDYSRRALATRKIRFDTLDKITLSLSFLGSAFLLMGSRGRRKLALAGLLGLWWVGLDVYGHVHFGTLDAMSAVNAFYFGKSFLSGICVVTFLSIVWPQGRFRIVLAICATLFIAFNVYSAKRYDLRHFEACPRAFYSGNGLLIGIAIASAVLVWPMRKSALQDVPSPVH